MIVLVGDIELKKFIIKQFNPYYFKCKLFKNALMHGIEFHFTGV
jgi:hypothetical protein